MKKCEVCGRECEWSYKFCPECGSGFVDVERRDRANHSRPVTVIAAAFPATVFALTLWEPGITYANIAVLAFASLLFFVIGEVTAEMLYRRFKNRTWLCIGAQMGIAVVAALALNFLLPGTFPIFG